MEKELTGTTVFIITASAFGVILLVNLALAFSAVKTFPGLETKNSYVASQSFDERRTAQLALGWTVDASVEADILVLSITDINGDPVRVASLDATLGRATHVKDDITPAFVNRNGVFTAPVNLAPGNWNIRMQAVAADGTRFTQRIVLVVES
ncbi:FixH family protein [Parasulfitobacter algicola]|uniref:FixH family protein n=1 Tax=Parasulfitobacter algicola TaxID=2614809 RepID=A0ABX2IT97_9RHOB|nr:FixH family protein [Sulfitobacter algicola]NSX56133.1 FixH family protein [Sulfitobacter algicola]